MTSLTWQPLAPLWALALVIVPLLGLTVWRTVRAGHLGVAGAPRAAWVRRAVLVLLVGLIGLGPSTPVTTRDTQVAALDVFFVVDRTGSMAAEDYDGERERLDGVRHDIVSLTGDLPAARYSVISFDSQASRQLPLTTDARAIESWAETFRREITYYSQGSLTDRPLDELRSTLEGSAEQRPGNLRIVFFLSDGEQTADGEPRSFADLAPLVDGGAVLGYGTAEGGPMKDYDPNGDPVNAPYILDPTDVDDFGNPQQAVSRIDEENLTAIAEQLGVPYVHRDGPTPTADLVADIDPEQVAEDGRRDVTSYRHLVWPFALGVAGLLAVEAWFWGRTAARSRTGVRA